LSARNPRMVSLYQRGACPRKRLRNACSMS
jgi:hypothetical protein